MSFHVYEEKENPLQYRELLLQGDPNEEKIEKYVETGRLFVLEDDGVQAVCVISPLSGGVYELNNLAVRKESRGQGHGRHLIESLFVYFFDMETLRAATGDHAPTLAFYERCGFEPIRVEKDYFLHAYDKPVVEEDGTVLKDRIVLEKNRKRCAHCTGHEA